MPLPALIPAIGALMSWGYGTIPAVIGGMLPSVIDAIASAKTPEEARAAIAPKRDAMVAQMVGRGTPRAKAEEDVDAALAGEVEKKMQEGALPGWATAALSIAGGIGGAVAGHKIGGKLLAKGAKPATTAAAPAKIEAAATKAAAPSERVPDEIIPPFRPRLGHTPERGYTIPEPRVNAPQDGGTMPMGDIEHGWRQSVRGARDIPRRPPQDILEPFALEMSPETMRRLDQEALRERMNRY